MAPPGVRLFNSASRQVEPFVPLVPGQAGIYDCGPTVYDWQTIGNLYRYIVSDVTDETDSLSARRHDGVNGRLYPTRIEIEHPDRVSVATKAPGRRAADAGAGSRYERSQLVSIRSRQ